MSDFRVKLASLKRLAGVPEIKITGYQAYKGINMLFMVECDDPTFAQKISNNDLTKEERSTLVEDVAAYFDDNVKTDENLFEYGIAQIVIDAMEGNFTLPKRLINEDFLNKCTQKKQKSDIKVFNKTKFRNFPLSEKIHIVNDPYDFFMYVWGDDYKSNNVDIRNLIVLNGTQMDDLGDEKDASKNTSIKKLADIDMKQLLKKITEELIISKAKEIGWNYDGGEYDLIAYDPKYEAALAQPSFEKKLLDIIAVVNQWGIETKQNHM